MSPYPFLLAVCTLHGFAFSEVTFAVAVADEPRKIIGRIIDERDLPIENVTIAETWKSIEPDKNQPFGKNETLLTPQSEPTYVSDSSGKFTLEDHNSCIGFLAIDSRGERGAIAYWNELKESDTNEIRLGQLTQISCRIPKQFQSKEIDRVYLTLCLKEVETQPLANTRLVHISGVSDHYNFKLPPGSYRLLATIMTKGNPSLELGLAYDMKFTINGQRELELGELPLRVYTDPTLAYARKIQALKKRQSESESESRTKLFGQIAPSWISIDGTGLDHRANIEALRGKWVLLEFWGLNCVPCLREGIPGLIDFYERNEQHRERFEIVGLFLDFSGEINSVDSLQKAIEPIKKNVWGGKDISFPIIIDNTLANWERYAIQGLGDYLLIDPNGRVTRGDLGTLQKILDGN